MGYSIFYFCYSPLFAFILILDKNKTKTAGGGFLIKEVPTQKYVHISSRADANQGRPGRWICLIFIEI